MNWHSWLFIVCFIALATWGLWLSWLWCYRANYKRWRRQVQLPITLGKFGRSKRRVYYIPHK